ncbi:MAG: hypothetical protein M1825_000357 [Sarcosagium campestre]|nr:MAG: hypothetical protein M1825_000357 [Sarcosagium campestre]
MAGDAARHRGQKRPNPNKQFSKSKKYQKTAKEGTNEEVLVLEIRKLLADPELSLSSNEQRMEDLPEHFTEIEVDVHSISSTGDGLAISPSSAQVYVVPFTVPGDRVVAKVIRHFVNDRYSLADFVRVIKASPRRDDSLVRCPYFSTCSGCQLQMLSYADQLAHKKTIIEKAYKNFSRLESSLVPAVEDIIGSPKQYGYRTKLTPHFDGPPGSRNRKNGIKKSFSEIPKIGFNGKGMRKVIDIEDCPIATDVIRKGLKLERQRVKDEISTFSRGATLLLRQSLRTSPKNGALPEEERDELPPEDDPYTIVTETETDRVFETCITKSNEYATEHIDSFVFNTAAGSFFQNNASILPTFISYLRSHLESSTSTAPSSSSLTPTQHQPRYLIDAYCGSGLFTITLSALFDASTGIDIAGPSITSAVNNAKRNEITNADFIAADATGLFKSVSYPADQTVVVLDPPRKGCDEAFLCQLMRFAPSRIVYVSCNVHTQARDVGVMVTGREGVRYEIERLGGFDFFPQTGHVEGVAFLKKIPGEEVNSGGVGGTLEDGTYGEKGT